MVCGRSPGRAWQGLATTPVVLWLSTWFCDHQTAGTGTHFCETAGKESGSKSFTRTVWTRSHLFVWDSPDIGLSGLVRSYRIICHIMKCLPRAIPHPHLWDSKIPITYKICGPHLLYDHWATESKHRIVKQVGTGPPLMNPIGQSLPPAWEKCSMFLFSPFAATVQA